MFRPVQNFTLRSQPNDAATTPKIITTEFRIDIVDDVGEGWVKINAYDVLSNGFEGFVKRTSLKETDIDPVINKTRFIGACLDGAFDFKTNAAYLLAVAEIESKTKNIPAKTSSAVGPFQILSETWEQYRVDPKINLSPPDRYDPYLQPEVAAKIAADGTSALAQILPNQVNPTPPELYFSHLFGVSGASKILNAQNRTGDIQQALLRVYANDADPAARAAKIIAANKGRLAPNGAPLAVEEIIKAVGKDLADALAAAVPPEVAAALDAGPEREFVAMAESGDTSYWIVEKFDDDSGGQLLVRQVGANAPEILASDTTLLPLKPGLVPPAITVQLNKAQEPQPPFGAAGPAPGGGANIGALVLAGAMAANNILETKNVPGTKQGHLACAWAVNKIVKEALGKPIGGGMSTHDMFTVLDAHHTRLPAGQFAAGGIVISPTQGTNVGHVGIVGTIDANVATTVIYSNRSGKGIFSDFYKVGTWTTSFQQRGLPVVCFTLNANQF